MAIPAWAISLAMTAVSKKFAAETIDERLVREANEIPRKTEFDKKGYRKAGPLWMAVVMLVLFFLQSAGYIDQETTNAIKEFFSNPDIQDSISNAIDSSVE